MFIPFSINLLELLALLVLLCSVYCFYEHLFCHKNAQKRKETTSLAVRPRKHNTVNLRPKAKVKRNRKKMSANSANGNAIKQEITTISDEQSSKTVTVEEEVEDFSDEDIKKGEFSDPVYKELAARNGNINKLDRTQLTRKLRRLNLSTSGSLAVLKQRLKQYTKSQMLAAASDQPGSSSSTNCPYNYLCVIDFEATCVHPSPNDYIHEIIEFPIILLNTRTLKIEDEFHAYCRPLLNPKLSDFCTQLTGITQDQVDKADTFPIVFEQVLKWLEEHRLGTEFSFAVLTDGPWDVTMFLNVQCKLNQIEFPEWARRWVNIKKNFSGFYKTRRLKLNQMLANLGITFKGRLHSGLDDARNITAVVIHLLQDGCLIQCNETFGDFKGGWKETK